LHKKPEISLIICTHNRSSILVESLRLYLQIQTEVQYEIIVVLNACTDNTLQVVQEACKNNPHLRYVIEKKTGLSHARNAGWQNARAPFVFYIDDDAYPQKDIITVLRNCLNKNEVLCISGVTKYWSINSPAWINPEFVEAPIFRQSFGPIPSGGFINGCACGFSKHILVQIGGFDSRYGMKAKRIGYYDEVAAQKAIEQRGHIIYYSPDIVVFHQSHCKSVGQFLHSFFKKGQFRKRAEKVNSLKSFLWGCIYSMMGLFLLLKYWPAYGLNQAIIKSFSLPCIFFGQAFGE